MITQLLYHTRGGKRARLADERTSSALAPVSSALDETIAGIKVTVAPTPRLGKLAEREFDGNYAPTMRGRTAIDGALLNELGADCALASAWREPCGCIRADRRWLTPMIHWQLPGCRDPQHRRAAPIGKNPFPLEGEEFRRAEERAWSAVAERFHIPTRLRGARFGHGIATEAMSWTKRHVDIWMDLECEADDEPPGRCVALAGPPGLGKTWAAVAAFRAVAVHRPSSYCETFNFWLMPALVSALLDPDRRDDVLERALTTDFLVLDDVGGGHYLKSGGLAEALIEEIFLAREGNELMTIITTNLTPKRFKDTLGPRWTPQNRPYVDRAKPAKGAGAQGRVCCSAFLPGQQAA